MWILLLNIISATPDDGVMTMMPMELERNFFYWIVENRDSLQEVLNADDV